MTKGQDVILFSSARREFDEDQALRSVFARQAQVSLLACQMARLLYEARCIWIGGQCLGWDELTLCQRARYRNEAELLVKGDS